MLVKLQKRIIERCFALLQLLKFSNEKKSIQNTPIGNNWQQSEYKVFFLFTYIRFIFWNSF